MKIYYMGCVKEVGHYLWCERLDKAVYGSTPFGVSADGAFCPPKMFNQGQAVIHHKDGWTILSFWDNSIDKRPGSHSTFLAEGQLKFTEMYELSKSTFPSIFERFKFKVTGRD